jgi:hypothetical protein
MSSEDSASRRIRLSRGLRSVSGAPDRARLEQHLAELLPATPKSKWSILALEESDPLRDRILGNYRELQRSGALESSGPLTADEIRESLVEILTVLGSGGVVFVHFQKSERVGLLQIDLELLHSVALDLLAYDRDGILISEQNGKWGVLLDRNAEESGESYELVTWGLGKTA